MPDEPTYGLVMPFVVCASKGGPYDDEAFVAGAEYGQLHSLLALSPPSHEAYVRSKSVPQLDLLAMHFGYTFTAEPWDEHPDEWTKVAFTRTTHIDGSADA